MHSDEARKFYQAEHARPFRRPDYVLDQRDKYAAQDRVALLRSIPAGYFESREHYLLSIAGGGNANRNVLATRRATVAGLMAQGFHHDQIKRALNATSAEVDVLAASPPMARPHFNREDGYDPDELRGALREPMNRSGDSDGFRHIIPARRANAVRRV